MVHNIILFTVNTNNYDEVRWEENLLERCRVDKIPILYYTDRLDQKVPKEVTMKSLEGVLSEKGLSRDRKIKILAYRYLPEHKYSIYFDARINIKANLIDKMLEEFNQGCDWISFKHRYRESPVIETITACAYYKMKLMFNKDN